MKKRQSQRYELNTCTLKFEVSIIWNDADVDAVITPHLSACCGEVIHRIKNPTRTPIDSSVESILHYLMMRCDEFPKTCKAKESHSLCQGFASLTFEYDGKIEDLAATIEECKRIMSCYLGRYTRYYKEDDTERNSMVNAYAGTGSGIRRVL